MKVVLLLVLTIGLVSSVPFPEDVKETTTVAPPPETTTTEKLPSDKKPSEDAPAEKKPSEDAPAEKKPSEDAPAEKKPDEKEEKLEKPAPHESSPAEDDSKVSKPDNLSHTADVLTKLAEKAASLKAVETIGEALEHAISKRGIAADVGEEGEEEEEGEDDKSRSLKEINRMRRGIAEDSLQIDEVNTKSKTDDKTKNDKSGGKHRRSSSIQISGDSITIFKEDDDDKDANKSPTIVSTVSTRTARDTHEDTGASTQNGQSRMSRFKAARAILKDTKKMTVAEDTHLAALVPEGSGKGSETPIVAPKKLSGDELRTLLKERIAMRGSNRRSATAEQSMPEDTPVPKKPTEEELKMRAGGVLVVKQIRSRRNSNYEASSSDEPTAVETPSVSSSDKKYFATRNRVPENIRIAVQRDLPIESPKTLVKELPVVREVSDDSYGNHQKSLPESAPVRTVMEESTPQRTLVRDSGYGTSETTPAATVPILSDVRRVEVPAPTRAIVREEPTGYSAPTRTLVREEPTGYSAPTRTLVREEPTGYSAPIRTHVREESRYKRSSGGYGSSEPTRTIVSEEPASYSETTRTVVSEEPASYSEATRTVVSEEPASYSETTRTVVFEEPAMVKEVPETRYKRNSGDYGSSAPAQSSYSAPAQQSYSAPAQPSNSAPAQSSYSAPQAPSRYRRNAGGYGSSAPSRSMGESSGYSSASSDQQQSSSYSAPAQTEVRDDSSSYSAPQAPSRYRRNAVGYGNSSPTGAMDESSGYSSPSSDEQQSSSYSAPAQTEVRDDSSQAPSRYRRNAGGHGSSAPARSSSSQSAPSGYQQQSSSNSAPQTRSPYA